MRETLRLCFVLTAIGAACAALLAFVNGRTKVLIEQNAGGAKIDAMSGVLPPCDNDVSSDTLVLSDGSRDVVVHRGRKGDAVVGAAFIVVAPEGYSGEIEILVGVDTAGVVTGLEILRHLETPGLGSKIETPEFRGQYIGRSATDPATWAVEKDGGTFTPITGATISSRAVTSAVARALGFFETHRSAILGAAADRGSGAPPSRAGGR